MSEHVISAKFNYDDAGLISGMQRDVEATRALNAAVKEGAPAAAQLAESFNTLANRTKTETDAAIANARAQTAQSTATRAQSQATAAASNASTAAARATVAETQAAIADESAATKLATAKAKLEQQTAAAARAQAQLQETLRQNAASSAEAAAGISSIESKLTSATGMVKAFIAAWAVREAFSYAKDLVMEGVHFNAELEQTRIGSGAIISTFGKIYDAQGRLLKGVEAFNAGQKIGADLTEEIKTKTLQTTLLFSQMQDATRRSLAYELQYLVDSKNNVASNKDLANFTSSFAQGAVTFGLSPEEIPNNLRALLTGRADPRHARFAAALLSDMGTNDQAREQMDTWRQQDQLVEQLQKRLEAFAIAGQASMNSYTGALSNLHDAWQQLVGSATEGTTTGFTKDILDLRDSLFTIDKQGHAAFNQDLVNGITMVGDAMKYVVTQSVDVAKSLPEIVVQAQAVWMSAKKISDIYTDSYGGPKTGLEAALGETETQRGCASTTSIAQPVGRSSFRTITRA